LTGAADDAADATQEAFVAVLERLPKLESRELNFGAYLMTTARHSCYRLMERQGRAEPTDEIPEAAPLVGGGGGGGLGMPDPGDPGEDPERAALLKAQQEEVRAANARLPERQREVLALRELQEQRDSSNDQVNTQTGGGGSQGGALPGSGTIPPATGIPPATDSPPPPASTPPPSAPPPSTPPPPRTPPPGGGRAPGGP